MADLDPQLVGTEGEKNWYVVGLINTPTADGRVIESPVKIRPGPLPVIVFNQDPDVLQFSGQYEEVAPTLVRVVGNEIQAWLSHEHRMANLDLQPDGWYERGGIMVFFGGLVIGLSLTSTWRSPWPELNDRRPVHAAA